MTLRGWRRPRLIAALVTGGLAAMLIVPVQGFPTNRVYDAVLPVPGFGPIAALDLDGDGRPDLAAADTLGSRIYLIGQGEYGLGATMESLEIASPRGLAAARLDGDGEPDLAVLSGNVTQLLVRRGAGFEPHNVALLSGDATRIVTGKLNDDANADLAVLTPAGVRVWFQRAGPTPFLADADLNLTGSGFQSLAVADLDGNGFDDLIVAKPFDIRVYYQGKQGLSRDPSFVVLNSEGTDVTIAPGEVTGDDRIDLLLVERDAATGAARFVILAQGDNRTFAPLPPLAGSYAGSLAVGDLNDNGKADAALVRDDGGIEVRFQRPQGGFSSSSDLNLLGAEVGTRSTTTVGAFAAKPFNDLLLRVPGEIRIYHQEDQALRPVRPVPSSFTFNEGESGIGIIDLRNYFQDDHRILIFSVTWMEAPDNLYAMVDPDGYHLNFHPRAGWNGAARFRVAATDGPDRPAVESNDFAVTVNDRPRITSVPPTSVGLGEAFVYPVVAADAFPGSGLTFELREGPDGMRVDPSTGLVRWTPGESDAGDHAVTLAVRDGYGATSEPQSFVVRVSPVSAALPVGAIGAVGIVAALILLGLAGLISENVRWELLLFLLPLYSKIKRERVLDHFVRGQIYGYIMANPGEHYNAVKQALNLTNGSLAHHLKTLEREEFVKSKRFGLYRRFYPMHMRLPEDGAFTMNTVQRTMVDLVARHPGITQKEIADRLDITPPTVNYHIDILQKNDVVRVERRGRTTHVHVKEDRGP